LVSDVTAGASLFRMRRGYHTIGHMSDALPPTLNVALKEWATVCRALEQGRQILLLRKGGILEAIGGFELEHPQFLLFPTYVHQNLEMLKPNAREGFEPHSAEPAQIRLSLAGRVTDIIRLKSRSQMDAIDTEHVWTPPLVDMRFNYRPMNPLYLLLVRAYRLANPVTVINTPEYAGCKSWVPLEQSVDAAGAVPVLSEGDYEDLRNRIRSSIGAAAE
jgi:hypothetical protein